ncbi:MAG TPA: PspA/IM30 family protein [Bosea sp. (in: a-proteobacteria)]|jgi:phage shock protein A|uniref:PspA/IM30 family protein n=1 Tax=Bosea sp. (in: a-proteobacteria) TaxID=1871050 RepID=UPI002E0EF578|nr:PspA/IM30 family protein [Bosea sp. (in: a-proteobacteria)]
MFKMFVTLFRGGVAEAGEAIADRNALLILDQQVRDATAAFDRAKKSLAVAIAQDQQETVRLDATRARIAELEQRVAAALGAGDDVLAREGAEAIATLEADRDSASAAQALFAAEILRLRRHVAQAQARIAELDRGRRLARASEAVRDMRRGRTEEARPHEATLAEAEQTLKRLRERQTQADAADLALEELDGAATASVTEKLAARGYGPRLKPTADDVLARLRGKSAQSV